MPIQTCCVYAPLAEQAQLEQVARQGRTPQKVACRARIVLMLSNHEPPSSLAADLGISRMTVRLWADRFVHDGISGLLRDASRPGRRKQISPDKVQAVVEATLTTRPPAATQVLCATGRRIPVRPAHSIPESRFAVGRGSVTSPTTFVVNSSAAVTCTTGG